VLFVVGYRCRLILLLYTKLRWFAKVFLVLEFFPVNHTPFTGTDGIEDLFWCLPGEGCHTGGTRTGHGIISICQESNHIYDASARKSPSKFELCMALWDGSEVVFRNNQWEILGVKNAAVRSNPNCAETETATLEITRTSSEVCSHFECFTEPHYSYSSDRFQFG